MPHSDQTPTAAWLELPDGRRQPVGAGCTLGRGTQSNLRLPEERVSRRHALIHPQGGGEYWLVDLGSRNGTYLNGRRLSQPVRLQDADELSLGPCRLHFRQPDAAVPAPPATNATQATLVDVRQQPCWLLVADIVGSTELAQALSPSELAVVIGRWFLDCRGLVEQHGGMVNKYLGDGFLAYWNDTGGNAAAVAALLTALRAQQEVGRPAFRLAVHWGPVVMGGPASLSEESLTGPEVNFVFRMDKLAKALQCRTLLSEPASERLGSRVICKPAGDHPLPGFAGQFPFHEC